MKTLIIFVVAGLIMVSLLFAVNYAPRILVDTESHKLDINSDGSFSAKMDGSSSAPTVTRGYPPRMLADQDGHKLDINSDGSINLKGE